MSDTPFTDSRSYGFTDEDGIHCEVVHADFARKLERERDEARATIESLRDQLCADKCREKAAADRVGGHEWGNI